MKKGKKAALITVTAVLLILILLFGKVISLTSSYDYNPISTNPEDLGIEGGQIDEAVINVALFGIDTRGLDTFEGNADSIMILSLNTETKKIKIISVVRDTLVGIEDSNGKVTYGKINSAYQKGGPELAVKTLNQTFGLDIMKYATVNFYGMAEIIDAVGGIEATITQDELTRYPGYDINTCIKEICNYKGVKSSSYIIKKAGKQHLNGIQAVAYARIRMGENVWGTNNDFGRTDRQRYVMEQLFNKAKEMKASQFLPFAEALLPCVQTNYKPTEIASLASNILIHSPVFEQYRLPMVENGKSFLMDSPKGSFGSVVYYDLAYAEKAVHAIIYDDMTMDEFIEKNPIEKNDWYGEITGKSSSSSSSSSKPSTSTPSAQEPEDNDNNNTDNSDKPSVEEPDTGGGEEPDTPDDSTDGDADSGDSDEGDDSGGSSDNSGENGEETTEGEE